MKVYILDDLFWNSTTNYTGEEMQLYAVQLSIFEVMKLKKLGIEFTTDASIAGSWVKHHESIMGRDFGGIMVMDPRYSVKLNIPWDELKKIKKEPVNNSEPEESRHLKK